MYLYTINYLIVRNRTTTITIKSEKKKMMKKAATTKMRARIRLLDVSNHFKIFVLNDLQCANGSLNVRKLSELGHKSSRAVASQPTNQASSRVNDNYTN